MSGAYTVWYREGTVAVTKNSKNITGTDSYWVSGGIQPGDMFTTDGSNFFEVSSVTDSAHIILKTAYTGTSQTGINYAIIRNFNSGMSARVAAMTTQLLGYFDKYIDTDMQSIHGKSAYEIAVQNGYTGNVTEWLESLKAAGEWTSASARMSSLETESDEHASSIEKLSLISHATGSFTAKNSSYGFVNHGTVLTDEHKEEIANETYHGLRIGDYWTINNHVYRIARFCRRTNDSDQGKRIMMISNVLYKGQMNEEATNEGGYMNSLMFTSGLDQAKEILLTDWGDLLKTFTERFTTTNAKGDLHSGGKDDSATGLYCMIPNYEMLYGRTFELWPQEHYTNYSNHQLPLTQVEISQGITLDSSAYWLQNCINDSTSFLYLTANGIAGGQLTHNNYKANQSHGVRVIFFIGKP